MYLIISLSLFHQTLSLLKTKCLCILTPMKLWLMTMPCSSSHLLAASHSSPHCQPAVLSFSMIRLSICPNLCLYWDRMGNMHPSQSKMMVLMVNPVTLSISSQVKWATLTPSAFSSSDVTFPYPSVLLSTVWSAGPSTPNTENPAQRWWSLLYCNRYDE